MSKIKGSLSFVLAVLILISSALCASAYTTNEIAKAAAEIIISQEGVYDSILKNDNGALSIGKIGWHGTNALSLLQLIAKENESQAKQLLGDDLYNEVKTSKNWNYRIINDSEAAAMKSLLRTNESHKVQDQLSLDYVKSYIKRGQGLGITDVKALIYFADIENQCGGSISERVGKSAIAMAGSASGVTLDILYQAALKDVTAGSSPSRRARVYNIIKNADIAGIVTPPVYSTGKYVTDADSGLRIRSGPGTDYAQVGSLIPKGTSVNVTQINGIWGKITYNGTTGWIYLTYAIYSSSGSAIKGDVNGDGRVTTADARLALRHSVSLIKLNSTQIKACDLNGDGKVTAAEARSILRVAANIAKF